MLVIHKLYMLILHLSYTYLKLDILGNRAEVNVTLS